MIDKIECIGENRYLINDDIVIELDDQAVMTAIFDENKYTKEEVQAMIDEIMRNVVAMAEKSSGNHNIH